ncbi:protein virilizer homolog [Sinocyclocheilus anshuiensis]|uniref:protein virilizer homolog n=1 Tax=Sinocyclocheilus anshuiensis TaxID=1608454 RepID=UPI0007BA8250|nr:PREDICTED: protein virilizer homolog [Sinocyclocheilus anshuiensis]
MAGDSAMELLFLDTFKHQSAELTNVDVVRFPYGVLITEVRVIPPGIKAHSNLPDSRAFGETAPHAFQLDLFFNNVSKPNAPVFDRLGSLEYDENKSIIFRPNGKINTDGLVLRGWYTCLTLAVYGTAERPHSHERDSPPPPPPPLPQQQQLGSKRIIKTEWENEEQFNGSPPRPQPRGPRTPPGPPPPDDDDEEALPVPGQCPVKVENTEQGDDYLEPVSPERGSLPADENYSDAEQEDDEGPADDEEDEDVHSEGSEGDEDEEEVGEEVTDEEGEGDDGYEQISSDEEDLESGAFKLPAFDLDYTPEDLASLPTVQYDPYERELRPLQHFTPPHITRYEAELKRLKTVDIQDSSSLWAESAAKLSELLEAWGEGQRTERGAGWVTALEEIPAFLLKGMSFLSIKDPDGLSEKLKQLVDWSCEALNLDFALAQPIALNLRQLKAGTKLASALADCGAQAVQNLLEKGIVGSLLGLLFAEHVSSTLKLNVLRSLDSIISEPQGIEALLRDRHHDNDGTSGYQRLLDLFLLDQTVRVATAGTAILQKGHFYEVLTDLQRTASIWAERHPTVGEVGEREGSESEREAGERDRESTEREGDERERETQEVERESPMDIDTLLESASLSEGDLESLQGLLEELLHLLETAPHCMVQPPGKAFPTSARITGPPERDDPYPTLYRYMHACHLLESLAVVLSYPATFAHIGVLQSVRELMRFLSQSQQGLLFLLSKHETTNLLLRLLTPLTHLTPPSHLTPLTPLSEGEGEDAPAGGEGSMDDGFWVWLMQTLHALQGVAELNGAELEDGDNPSVLATLHCLYLISFSSTGRNAVAHAFSLDNNLSSLVNLVEFHAKEGQGEGKARKSVTYNYACMLVLLVIQTSGDLRMIEHYAAPLLNVSKADENNAKLQELSKWLEPLEKLHFDISGIPTLIDYIKQNLENLMTADGVGLVTALRVLCHIACPPTTVPGQQKDLKWNQAIIALFSAEGMDTFIKVLQKLTLLLLPWRLHGPMGPTAQRLMMLSVASCSLRLIRAMLTELLCGGTCEFRDVRVPSVCVALHKILCSTPTTGRLDAEELRIQGDVTEIMLTFTHAISEQMTGSEETVAGNSWSLMLREVLNSTLAAPENIYSSLSLLSELLPLPLPMQTTQALSVQDIGVAMNTRKLWSVHLHAQARVLQEVLRCVCVNSCPPLLSMFRRVCVQLCDLAAPTATLVMRTLLEQLQEEMQQEAAGSRLMRLLALLDSLASQRACKSAMLALTNAEPEAEPTLPAPEPLQTQFNHRTVFVLSDVLDEQLKALWFSPFQSDEMETEVDMVKVDLVALAQQCCPDLNLKAELERSFLSEPTSPGHSKPSKGFRLGKHKHETFITSSGNSDYVEPAKRAHFMAAPRGRGRGAFGQLSRPHDIFRQRKQNTSRPPSMHVDDFLAAEFKEVGQPTGLALPKRPPKGGGAKPPTRGLFTGGTRGRGFQNHARFFTPPAPKSVLLAGNYPRREGGRGSTWSTPVSADTHRGTYSEPRGGQSNFTRPLPSRQPPTGAYRLAPRDRATRGRGMGLSWLSGGVSVGGGGVSGGGRGQGKFNSGGGGRGRHVRSFTR